MSKIFMLGSPYLRTVFTANLNKPDFLRLVNSLVLVLIAGIGVSCLLSSAGIIRLTVWSSYFTATQAYSSPVFIAIYTAIALLNIQNLILFYLTRRALYLVYCFYIFTLSLSLVFYTHLPQLVGITLPMPEESLLGLWFGAISQSYIVLFALLLLIVRPQDDKILTAGVMFYLLEAGIVYFDNPVLFVIWDLGGLLIFGTFILYISCRALMRDNSAALVFFLAFGANYLAYLWSTSILLWPDLYADLSPFFADSGKAENLVWMLGLMTEAALMSIAIHLHIAEFRKQAITAALQTGPLEDVLAGTLIGNAAVQGKQDGVQVLPDRKEQFLRKLKGVIADNIAESHLDVDFLASNMAVSKATLFRRVKENTGLSPILYIRRMRLDTAYRLLEGRKSSTVAQAANAAGFNSLGHFSRHFRDRFGCNPASLLKE